MRDAISAAVAFSVLSGLLLGCKTEPEPLQRGKLAELGFAPASVPTSHPNASSYRGGSMESFEHFELVSNTWKAPDTLPDAIHGIIRTKEGSKVTVLLSVNVVNVEPDPCVRGTDPAKNPKDVNLYEVSYSDARGNLVNLCGEESYPEPWDCCETSASNSKKYVGKAIAVPGFWDVDGNYDKGGAGEFSLSCMNGAVAKCVHWGYRPWSTGVPDLAPYYTACVNAARASYNDDERSYSCSGTWFWIYDSLGIQKYDEPSCVAAGVVKIRGEDVPSFESRWAADHLVCAVRHRWEACDGDIKGCPGDNAVNGGTCADAIEKPGEAIDAWWPKDGSLLQVRSLEHSSWPKCVTHKDSCPSDPKQL